MTVLISEQIMRKRSERGFVATLGKPPSPPDVPLPEQLNAKRP
jgi:hypothetical protein